MIARPATGLVEGRKTYPSGGDRATTSQGEQVGMTPEAFAAGKRAENVAFLVSLGRRTAGRIYEGTVPHAEKLRRRAKNRVARRSRVQNRSK